MRFLKMAVIGVCILLCAGCAAGEKDKGNRSNVSSEQRKASDDNEFQSFSYEIDKEKGTSSVVGYVDQSGTEIVIPESFEYEGKEYSVTSIAQEAFYGNPVIKKVTIPETVTSIGQEAFCMCEALESVDIPGSVTTLGTGVFSECSSLKTVTVGEGVVNLPNETFSDCYALETIKLPETLTAIGSEVFWACENLSELELPKSVVSIGERSFYSSGIKMLKVLSPSATFTEDILDGATEIKELYVAESLVDTVSGLVDDEDVKVKAVE